MAKVPTFIWIIILTSAWQTLTCYDCVKGYWGEACDKQCPANCVACTHNSRDRGLPCTSCVPGKYSGRWHDDSDETYYDDCRHDCSLDCVSCTSWHNCTECVKGRYGTECQNDCYGGCEGDVCDKMDGKCTCITGYKSRFCYEICMNGLWGEACDKQCPANCVTCTHNSRDRGLPCTSCVPGKYSGRWRLFSGMPYYDDCRQDCRDRCVSCASYDKCTECVPGKYSGRRQREEIIEPYYDDCRAYCKYECVSCASYDNCTECVNGRYGTDCQYYCYSGCEGGQCDKMDGKCACRTGYKSRFCKDQPSCTSTPCSCCKNNTCETKNSNYCTDGCIHGVRGDRCDNECPLDCETCTLESVDRRPCTTCVSGKYSGRVFDWSSHSYYDDCRHDCMHWCASCASFKNCTECVDGRYGTECQYDCYSRCEGGHCDKMDGKCTCTTGYESIFCKGQTSGTNDPCACCRNNKCETNNDNYCTDGCIDGYYGNTCGNLCPANCITCTQYSVDSGRPCTSCVAGKYIGSYRDWGDIYYDDCRYDCDSQCVSCSSFLNCTECVDGRYGSFCYSECSTGCEGNKCNDKDGSCSCVNGRYGTHCDAYCSTGCEGGICNKTDGSCSCVDGRYGTRCQYDCYSGCKGSQCDKIDGKCKCTTGYESRFCKTQSSCTTTPCACCKNNKCDTNNYCTYGCIDGVRGDRCDNDCHSNCETCTQASEDKLPCTSCVPGSYIGSLRDSSSYTYYDDCSSSCIDTCVSCTSYYNCTECVNGRYGTKCQHSCYSGCEGGQCDQMDGKCTCKTGYAGRFCKGLPSCTDNLCACCKNNTCATNNDTFCTEGCIDGTWGDVCGKECSINCETCTQGSEDRGRLCTSCVRGKYIGHRSGEYYDDCSLNCRSECMSCTVYDNCTECVKGRYGTYCHNVCSTGCEGGICNITNGSCSCLNGRYGTQCEYSYGNGCHEGSCDQTNGSCSCKTGFSGDKCCVNNNNCENCSSNTQCSVCIRGYSGDKCCVNNEKCLTCVSPSACSNCKPGYDINTNCIDCLLNKYGPNCSSDCNSNCVTKEKQSKCYGHNGTCVDGCQEGFYGDKCDLPCHKNCKQSTCSRVNGICSYGCQDGFNIFESYCVPDVTAMPINDDGDFPVETLGGAICGVLVLFIIAGIVVILIKRRNHRPQCCSATTHDETPEPEEIQLVAVNAGDNETSEVCINGTISYHPGKVLGHGTHGIVYQGRYGRCEKRTVAVKIIKCSNDDDARDTYTELQNIYKEIKALEILAEETHIIQFFDSYINNTTVYLVFKLAMGTLVDFIKNDPWRKSLTSDNVIRGLVNGLNHIHTMNIVHRDIKPGNIFIIDHGVSGLKAVIGDFGQAKPTTGNMFTFTGNFGSNAYTAPEIWAAMSATATTSVGTKLHKASDVFSLGLVAYYAISLGKHPFGNEMNAQVSISRGDLPTFNDIAHLINSFAYEDMLKGMLDNNPDDRPSIQVVSEHPALFTSDKVIKFFGLKSDEFESKIRAGTSNTNLLEDPNLIPNGNWMNRLPVNLGTYLRSYKLPNRPSPLYKGHEKEVRFLLRAVRNTNGHFQAYPKNTQSEMGIFPEGHVDLWLTVCPGLLMHVYNKL